ncbi:TIGR03808 family TAT-translocated repetitive protein [Microbaculum marinisediminis]|uniref:TIGR03808 family TAT-translocated repetitive protein n=1 Tax=Microbaculum marinisediminis TaxID=2931392 RepID=A0AAW5QYD3_9HYPH|nr:TIGR03808 family TAT-translocated repetitive protein [Microbaculum sp. A6E488]MCT8971285.1 TIGR03808 family TAT-translocated repetitive protein [Microbaculum sp. A6E488]
MNATTRITRRGFLLSGAALAATGAAARPACAQAYGLDAARFGIVADSSADQTAALQRAINETRITGTPLFLPPGRYLARGLVLRSGARITGVAGASRLVALGDSALVSAQGGDTIGLDGLVFDGVARELGGAQALVDLSGVKAVSITDCTIENSWADGLYLNDCGGRVANTSISGALGAGLFSLDGHDLDITGNHVFDCGDNGIMVWQSAKQPDGAMIANNRVERIHNRSGGDGPYGNGIVVFRGGDVTVTGNHVRDCTFSAIRVNSGSNTIVAQNNCTRLGEVAIFVEFAYDGAVVANNIVDTATHGISVTNLDQGGHLAVVSGNLIRNIEIGDFPEPRGNGIFVSADTSLTGNVVENAAASGFALGFGPYLRNVTATGNVVRKAAVGFEISVVEGIEAVLVADNVISQVSKAAILGMEWDTVVTGDLAEDGAEAYPALTIARNRVG